MEQLKIRETSADPPGLPEEAQLTQVNTLADRGKLISRFELAKTVVRAFNIEHTQLLDGRIRSLRADSSWVKGLTARSENVTLDHVVFTDCRLDYAALSQIRTKGPVLFAGCSLREAEFRSCDLGRTLFDQCDLTLTDFGPGGYRGCDLRGNDLATIRGAHHLKRVVIDRAQLLQLAEALAADLEVSFGDERPDSQ